MAKFNTKRFNGRNPRVYGEKDETSPNSEAFFPGSTPSSVVELLPHADEDSNWVRIRRRKIANGPFMVGWMQRGHLDAPAEPPAVAPITVAEFVRACARQELGARVGGDPAHAVLADYLIALALIESGLERFEPQIATSDGVGPYQFGSKLWDALATAEGLTPEDRFVALNQIPIAAAVARRDWGAYSALARPGGETAPDGPFVPSFLNLFHAWLIGVPAAHEVDRVNAQGDPGAPIGPILEKHHPGSSNALMAARAAFLHEAGQDVRVAGFVRRTSQALNEALAKAAALLVQHFPEFAIPNTGTAAPWMAIAEREQHFWDINGLVESSPAGAERVRAYFGATDHPITAVEPWCGAYAAYCLKEADNARAAASVISGAARAANWKTWGDLELRGDAAGALRRGAIVLLSPAKDTGASGHVAFATGAMAGTDRVFLLGGNQSQRVKVSDFPISRIVAVRWLDVEQSDESDLVPAGGAPGAVPDDLLTMARTLYGEARGEPREGIEAVASVIMNRVRSSRYPSTISGACLQPFQFSCWNKNDPNRQKIINLAPNADSQITMCMQIATDAINGRIADPTNGALHYHSIGIARPEWVIRSPGATKIGPIGSHIFYSGIK